MRTVTGTHYEVKSLDGHYDLVANGTTYETALQSIEAAEARAKAHGYDCESWLIVQVDWSRTRDENDIFVRSEETHVAIARYENGVVTRLEDE